MGKRRGHGEGAIYQRTDGYWVTSVDLGYRNGKRRRRVLYGKTRREVAEKLRALQLEMQQGIPIVTEHQTLAQFLDQWLQHVIKPHSRSSTYESYAQVVRLYLVPYLGHHQLNRLAPEHVQTMLNTLLISGGEQGTGLSPRTVQYTRSILRQALNQALDWGRVARNVATLVKVPRGEKFKITPLSPEQARQLLEAVRGHRLEALYRVVLSFGLRKGEVLGLRWTDIDFAQGTLRVEVALQRQGGKLELVPPKTDASARLLPLTASLQRALKLHHLRLAEDQAFFEDEWEDHGLVFPSERGTPMEPRNLIRHFKSVLKKAGLPETVRFHDLRHSCATLLISQGVHPRIVMEILGHSQISVTMNTYGHALPDVLRDAASWMDAILADGDDDDLLLALPRKVTP